MSAFEEYGVMPEIIKAVEELEWLLPTDVQAEAIPLILGGGDVLMAAETGSGKTGAFCLPVLQIVHESLTETKYAKAATASGPQAAAMSANDRDLAFAIAEDGLLCQSRDKDWQGGRATVGIARGKYYYEAQVTDEGLCRFGWSTVTASRNLGTDKQGFGFGGTGKKSFGSAFENYGEPFGRNDVIGCYIDMDAHVIGFTKNAKDLGKAFDIPPHLHRLAFYPATVIKNAEVRFNFGAAPFKHPIPGYAAVAACPPEHSSQASQSGAALGSKKSPLALILEPSRELAQQTYGQLMLFKKHLASELNVEVFVGGVSAKDQISELRKGVDIAVGTPGRLDDLITNAKLDLAQVRFLILDEADGLLAQGHKALIQKIYNAVPKEQSGRRLQMIVCSATLHSNDVKQLAQELLHYPTWIDLKGKDAVPDTVHQVMVRVSPDMDLALLSKSVGGKFETDGIHSRDTNLLRSSPKSPEAQSEAIKRLKPYLLLKVIDAHKMDQAIIFCRTKLDCDHVRNFLQGVGGGTKAMVNAYSCVCLHSDVRDRAGALQSFKSGDVRFLLCTDVAARGIDISGLPFVINYTLPETPEDYIHRIGRVGRAERMGLAISLVATVPEKVWYHSCANRGKDCSNTSLKENGGCAIWYDEPEIMRSVQIRTGETVSELTGDYTLATQTLSDGKVVYGEKRMRGGGGGEEYQSHTDQLAPSVQELSRLEYEAQSTFWGLRSRQW